MFIDIKKNRKSSKWLLREQVLRVIWSLVHPLFWLSPRIFWFWRVWILRLFGASIGKNVHLYPSALIELPWNLTICDHAAVGDRAILYNLGRISIGEGATISAGAHLCAGTHDYRQTDLPLVKAPIIIGEGAWVCSGAFVGPGVTVGDYAIVGACSVAKRNVDSWTIVDGKSGNGNQEKATAAGDMKVSILILTYNEAQNLPRCLDALKWCDDIVVVDSGSTDDTVVIASSYNARVLHRPFDDFAAQRNFGLDRGEFRNDWVLHLDADEVVTPAFTARLLAVEASENLDAYDVPSKIIMSGRWLRRAGMYPVYQVRLGRVGRLRFRQIGHGQREDLPRERIGVFDEPYLHFAFSHGLRRWLEKHVTYAASEAEELVAARRLPAPAMSGLFANDRIKRRRVAKELSGRIPLFLRPLVRFLYVYMLRGGFLDGAAGLCYASMLAVYEANIAILAHELLSTNGRQRSAGL